jgi:hypothetical protein
VELSYSCDSGLCSQRELRRYLRRKPFTRRARILLRPLPRQGRGEQHHYKLGGYNQTGNLKWRAHRFARSDIFTDNRKHRGISKLKKHETEFGQSAIDVRCLAEATGGQYIQTNNQEELVEAFQKTLGCPMMSRLAPSVAFRSTFDPRIRSVSSDCLGESVG